MTQATQARKTGPMSAPVSRTVRLRLDLLARLERVRERIEERAGVPVDLRTVVERIVEDGVERDEKEQSEAAA